MTRTRPSLAVAAVVFTAACSGTPAPPPSFPAVESRVDALIARVRAEDGFTVDPRSGQEPTTGYVVGSARDARVVPAADLFGDGGRELLLGYLRDNAGHFTADPAVDLGAWYDRGGERVVLSLVSVVADRDSALRLGVRNNQRLVYDVAGRAKLPTGVEVTPTTAGTARSDGS